MPENRRNARDRRGGRNGRNGGGGGQGGNGGGGGNGGNGGNGGGGGNPGGIGLITRPAIYVDFKRCIGCNACSLACKQENTSELPNSPAQLAGTGKYVAAGQRWNEVYQYEEGTYPDVRPEVIALTFSQCTMCAHRLAAGLLPACVITCMGITREFGDYEALKRKYPDAEHMEDGVKETVLFGNLREPEEGRSPLPPSGYLPANDCRQCHN